jgi:hypothetical protein
MFYCSLIAHVPGNFTRFTHNIFAIAVAQLPPPITANFISAIFFIEFNQSTKELTLKFFVTEFFLF